VLIVRNQVQVMIDRLLLLYVIAKGSQLGSIDTFKLMKIPFMSELASTRKGVNTFNYSFFRYTYGPFTTEIYEDANSLDHLGLAAAKSKSTVLTEKGAHVLKIAEDLFAQNSQARTFVDMATRECAPLGFGDLKQKVYREKVLIGSCKASIADAPMCSNVLSRLVKPEASFLIDDDWVDTLWKYFHYTDDDLASADHLQPLSIAELALQ
jgi:hypothetical protein